MAETMQKIKLMKLYELLQKETDSEHAISRTMLCQRLIDMGISSNVRTLSKDIDILNANGYEVMSYLKDKEKFYYVPEHTLTIPEIKILIDAVQAASFVTEKKTAEQEYNASIPFWGFMMTADSSAGLLSKMRGSKYGRLQSSF